MPTLHETTRKVFHPYRKHYVTYIDRQAMKVGHPKTRMQLPVTVPTPPVAPFDWSKANYFPMDGNDIYGDCMMAAAEHADNTFTGNNGLESRFNDKQTVSAYLALSGGDNGLNSGQIISFWENGLAGVPAAKIMDAMDIDTTDPKMVQTAIWLFGGVFFTLDVPDTWDKNSYPGAVWDAPASADRNNGHGVWWNGVDNNGNYHTETWGYYVWITPAGVKTCDPGGFVVFSRRWFNSSGVAPNGYTYQQLSSWWTQMGGKTLPVWPLAPVQTDRLYSGQGFLAGSSIRSADQRFTLTLQDDGNLVLYGPQGQSLWASNTAGKYHIFDAVMQADGNFVLYGGDGSALWASNTNGKNAEYLIVQNDGNVVIYDWSGHPLWATNTTVPPEPARPTQGDRLLPGQGLLPGASIRSADGRFTLYMQTDGNLVMYGPGNQPLWASNTGGHGNIWECVMQTDGNLVVYDGQSHPLWASGTGGRPGAWFVVQNDGNLVVYDANSHPLWASNTGVPAAPGPPTVGGRLYPYQGLIPGRSIVSPDGRFTLTLQPDGNLVLYGPGGQVLWASNTAGHTNVWELIMQADGNLVMYDAHGHAFWASNTGTVGSWLTVQNDGNVVIYDNNQHPHWATNTVVPSQPASPSQPGRLLGGEGLIPGKSLTSTNGLLTLTMQTDGNLVLYNWYNEPLWRSKTNGKGQIWDAVMQTDGNFVIYDDHSTPLWASNTSGHPGSTLYVQDDGNVVIYDGANDKAIWATNTSVLDGVLQS